MKGLCINEGGSIVVYDSPGYDGDDDEDGLFQFHSISVTYSGKCKSGKSCPPLMS